MPPRKTRRSSKRRTHKSMGVSEFQLQSGNSSHALKHLASGLDNYKGRWQTLATNCLHAPVFEYSMGFVILCNIFVMIIEIDREAKEEDAVSTTVDWTEIFGWAVLFLFAVELFVRLFAFRTTFWMDYWNIFDFMIVATDITVFFLGLIFGEVFPVAILRLFRLAKLARVAKVLRVFPELRLLLASLFSAFAAIFWGAVLLFLILLGWSMAAVLFIHPLNRHVDYDGCERCLRAYSSVMHAALTFWRGIVAGDSWGENTIPLMEKHPSTAMFFIPLFLTVGMAVVSLILGMVVSVAQQAKDNMSKVDDAQATATKLERQSNLLQLCRQMDTDNSGEVSQDELLTGFEEPGEFRDSMEMLGITREDFEVVWAILDPDGTGSVPYKRLVSRLYGLRTSDSQFTLAYLKYHITLIKDILTQLETDHEEDMAEEKKIEEALERIEKGISIRPDNDKQLSEKLQASALGAPEQKLKSQGRNGLAARKNQGRNGLAAAASKGISEAAIGKEPKIQQLLEKLLVALDKESGAWSSKTPALGREMSEAAKGVKPQAQKPVKETVDECSSTNCDGGEIAASGSIKWAEDIESDDGLGAGDEEVSGAAEGKRESQIPELLEQLLPALERISHTEQPGEEMAGTTKSVEDHFQEPVNETLSRSHEHSSVDVDSSQGKTPGLINETDLLLQKVSRDIDMLRLELNDVLMNADFKFSTPPCSPIEQDILTAEAQLQLLVVPERASSWSFFPRCDKIQPPAEIPVLRL